MLSVYKQAWKTLTRSKSLFNKLKCIPIDIIFKQTTLNWNQYNINLFDGGLVTFLFRCLLSHLMVFWCFYYDYVVVRLWSPLALEALFIKNTWWNIKCRGDLPRPEGRKTQTAENGSHCASATLSSSEFINFRWILEWEQMFSCFIWGYPPLYRKSLCWP